MTPRQGDRFEFFDDLAIISTEEKSEEKCSPVIPEPTKRVTVVFPYSVSHDGHRYGPNEVAEVPESVADEWIRSRWAVSVEAPKRGNRR